MLACPFAVRGLGTKFVAVGVHVGLPARGVGALARSFTHEAAAAAAPVAAIPSPGLR